MKTKIQEAKELQVDLQESLDNGGWACWLKKDQEILDWLISEVESLQETLDWINEGTSDER